MGKMNSGGTFMGMEIFLVASMYNVLILSDLPVHDNKKIWKIKIPQKNCMVFTSRGYSY
jgi:hypothetical protein